MTKYKTLNLYGCVINKNNIIDLVEMFSKYTANLCIYISFEGDEDSLSLTALDFKKIDFSNKAIYSITIRGYTSYYKEKYYFSVELEESTVLSSNYRINITSDCLDDFAILSNSLSEWIKKVQTRNKSVIAFINSGFVCIPLLALLIVVPLLVGSYFMFRDNHYVPLIVMAFVAIGVLLSWFIYFLVTKSFPITEIDIGKNKHAICRKRLSWLICTIVFPLIFMIISIFIKI